MKSKRNFDRWLPARWRGEYWWVRLELASHYFFRAFDEFWFNIKTAFVHLWAFLFGGR